MENLNLNPWWVTGLVDAEGCFHVSITERKDRKLGWAVKSSFNISFHTKDKAILKKIKSSLGVGKLYEQGSQSNQFRVESLKELELLVKHFNKYPLITKKRADLKLFLMVMEIMIRKEHLTEDGLRKIVAIKAAMNLGLSEKLELAFPDLVPVGRPQVENSKIIDPQWLARFTSGEGCFFLKIYKSNTKLGESVQLEFQLTQHIRDENLMKSFILFFQCGTIRKRSDAIDLRVYKLSDITDKIIPFFLKHPIIGVKALDFADWCEVAEMMNNKEHLTPEGLENIKKIKAGMNRGRSLYKLGIEKMDQKEIFYNNYINKFNKLNVRHYSTGVNYNQFGSYLAGLFEADGHIWIQKTFSGKKHNPRFCITFGLKNEPLAKKLFEILESGFIRYKNSDNACVIVISSVAGLKKIVSLINGKLRTPKIGQLEALVNWLNKHHNANILLLPLCQSSLLSDGWLSGFIEGDGSFSVQYTKKENAKKRKISCRLRIEQRMIDPHSNNSYFNILNKIATFLLCNLLTRKQSATGNTYYTLTASSLESIKVIINYFYKYPLYSSKYLDYKDWQIVAKWRLNNEHYNEEIIPEIVKIKENMNSKRTYFNWDHLKYLCLLDSSKDINLKRLKGNTLIK